MGKFHAQIILKKRNIYLGLFSTKENAHNAYLAAKLIYHVIN